MKLFSKMFPAKEKKLYTVQGSHLRAFFGFMLALNITAFLGSLVLVGFKTMLYAILLTTFSYSGYLTLREWVVILYILMLGACACDCFVTQFAHTTNSTW